ncbi:MAG: M20/M25/M40 family metallo-hydrolase [Pelolinea sp.]|jgi:carboxypeptidase PM20D1|nr:M20/M25/M40 family metallo-hydrolase [Pelolinea sp.]
MAYFLMILGILLLVFLIMLLRTLRLTGNYPQSASADLIRVTAQKPAIHLSEAIQFQTISKLKMEESDATPFKNYHHWLEKTYPKTHAALKKEIINQLSLLYCWKGSNPHLQPVLFASHLDVVPVDKATLTAWHADPFKGEVKQGFAWGRGALDMKNHTVALFEAMETLADSGFQPKRDIYFAFGQDEEISGKEGAKSIAALLMKRGIHLAAVLDEGGMISHGLIPGVETPLALVGIGEKEYVTVNLSAKGTPGHSSNPPRQTAIGILARAIALLDDNPFKARPELAITTLQKIAYLFPFSTRFALSNTWLLKPLLVKQLERKVQTNALIRTTHAATVIQGGIKDNVLPAEAQAKINFRLLPGDSQQTVLSHIQKVVADPRVKAEIDLADAWGPCKVSAVDTSAYNTLELVIRQVFGDIPVTPYLLMFATDARHYQEVSDQLYHFSPLVMEADDMSRMHGIDERIRVDALVGMVKFYARLLKVWGEAEF